MEEIQEAVPTAILPDEEPQETRDEPAFVSIPILAIGREKVCYNVPSFPVFNAILRRIQFQYTKEDCSILVADGFIRDTPSLDQATCPLLCEVPSGCPNGFFIDVIKPIT